MKTAILQCADQGPVESLAVMLCAVGYECLLPDESLLSELRRIGCDTVLSPRDLTRSMGYEVPDPALFRTAGVNDMDRCDLYVDVKGHRNGPKVWERWPRLRGKTLWYRINGGKPEHVVRRDSEGWVVEDCGDEVDPPCPVLTPNQWYGEPCGHGCIVPNCLCCQGRLYTCWPPFHRFGEYGPRAKISGVIGLGGNVYGQPICLVHNLAGWGGGPLIPSFRALGVKMYGRGSPDGLIQHGDVPRLLSSALAYVHIKSSDAPGYALYEALAAGCPVICSRRLIWRCRMGELLIPGKTCLVFDRETHDPLTTLDVEQCTLEVKTHLENLRDPAFNRGLGEAGRERLKEVIWSMDRASDVESLRAFMRRNFQ